MHAATSATIQPGPAVDVVRSRARRRTSSASVRDGRVVVRLPAHLDEDAAAETTAELLRRLRERAAAPPRPTSMVASGACRATRGAPADAWLTERAEVVARRWLPRVRATDVTWSHRMSTRWASCTVTTGRIRVSARLADAPVRVIDNILLHELAHLVETGHGPAFRALLARDPASEDVRAWLANRTRSELRDALGLT